MSNFIDFIHNIQWESLPEAAQLQAKRCLLDTLGAALSGRQTDLSRIIYEYAAANHGGDGPRLWLDGRTLSPVGAALAHGMTIDAIDIHDGHRLTKGHAGAALIPAVLAAPSIGSGGPMDGREILTALAMAYEISIRAGIVLHDTVSDYHTSGAWNALGCAAIVARRLGLSSNATRHALGIAEYHGPRSQMMRCIDHPTMLKDGSGWGAMAGVGAGLLAAAGFTGAPAITIEADDVQGEWGDLGSSWRINEQYFKPHAVCRWAQPALESTVELMTLNGCRPEDVAKIRVFAFHEAVRLAVRRPQSTEEAQYSLPFPVASAVYHGRLGAKQLLTNALQDERVLALADRIELIEDDHCNDEFPAKRITRVELVLKNGACFESGYVAANWDPENPPSNEALREKFRWLASDLLPAGRVDALDTLLWSCEQLPNIESLLGLLEQPTAGFNGGLHG